jgi:hypothetical protein
VNSEETEKSALGIRHDENENRDRRTARPPTPGPRPHLNSEVKARASGSRPLEESPMDARRRQASLGYPTAQAQVNCPASATCAASDRWAAKTPNERRLSVAPSRVGEDAPRGRPRRPARQGQPPRPGLRPTAVARLRSVDLPLMRGRVARLRRIAFLLFSCLNLSSVPANPPDLGLLVRGSRCGTCLPYDRPGSSNYSSDQWS